MRWKISLKKKSFHPKHTTNKYTEPQQYMHAIEKKKLTPPKQHKKTNQNKKPPTNNKKANPTQITLTFL